MRSLKLLAGLGNPGKRYERTRHNIGFRAIEHLADRNKIALRKRKFDSQFWQGIIKSGAGESPVVLMKPLTYMNRSGSAVQAAADYFRISPGDIIVIHDDLDLPFGKLRIRERGGDSGQRGIGSIIEALGDERFIRLRIGIGRPPVHVEPEDYVLEAFLPEEGARLSELLDRAVDALQTLVFEGSVPAMNRFNP